MNGCYVFCESLSYIFILFHKALPSLSGVGYVSSFIHF